MGKPVSKAMLAFSAAAALLATQPAAAAMGCWTAQRAAAAKVRDLQSRLMVATLRCKAMGYDVLAAYNDFIQSNREALKAQNGLIHAQFETGYGKDADLYYDRFATSLANRYGGDATSQEICDATAAAAQDGVAAAGDVAKLLAIEDRLGAAPELPGGACAASSVAPAAASPANLPIAAPATPLVAERPMASKNFGAAMAEALADASDQPPGADAPPPRADQMFPADQPR